MDHRRPCAAQASLAILSTVVISRAKRAGAAEEKRAKSGPTPAARQIAGRKRKGDAARRSKGPAARLPVPFPSRRPRPASSPTERESRRPHATGVVTTPDKAPTSSASLSHVGRPGAELHGVLLPGVLGARLRGYRPHAAPPGLRPRPQARRLHLHPRPPLPAGLCLRGSARPQGAGGGVATGEPEPAERAPQQGKVRQGGRRRRAVPAQGGPRGLRGLRPAARRAPGQVHLPLHRPPPGGERGDGAPRRRQRGRVRAHVRGQGRRLDARRGRPLEVASVVPCIVIASA